MPEESASTSNVIVGVDSVSSETQLTPADGDVGDEGADEGASRLSYATNRGAYIIVLLGLLFYAAVASIVCAVLYFSVAGMILAPVAAVLSTAFFVAFTAALCVGFSWTCQNRTGIEGEAEGIAASTSSELEVEQNITNAPPVPAPEADGAAPAASSAESQDQHEAVVTSSGAGIMSESGAPTQSGDLRPGNSGSISGTLSEERGASGGPSAVNAAPSVSTAPLAQGGAAATTTIFHGAAQSRSHTSRAGTSVSQPENPVFSFEQGFSRSGNAGRRGSHAEASLRLGSGAAAPTAERRNEADFATPSSSTTSAIPTRANAVPAARSKMDVAHWEESNESIALPIWSGSELSQDSSETSLHKGFSVNVVPSLSDLTPQDGTNVSGQDVLEFMLTPVDMQEFESIFDRREYGRVFDVAEGRTPDLDFLHFLKHPIILGDSFIVSNGAVFRWTSTLSKCGSQAESGQLWFAVKPHFDEGMRLLSSEEALQNPNLPEEKIVLCPDGGSCHAETKFFQRLFYPVRDEIALDRALVVKIMFDPAESQDEVSKKFAGDLLSSYITLQRGLLDKMGGGKWNSQNAAAGMKMLKKFLYVTEAGKQFANDILQHKDVILESRNEAFDSLSSESKGFLMLSANIVNGMERDVCDGIEAFASNRTNSRDTRILELYALMTPDARHLDYSLGFKAKMTDDKKASLLGYFLWDHNFRQVVIAMAAKWIYSVIPDDIDARDVGSLNDILDRVRNIRASDRELPVVCTAIPGLLESIFCLVQAFKVGPDALRSTFDDYYIDQMCLISDFRELGVTTTGTARVLRSFQDCGLANKTQDSDQYAHYFAVAEALVEARNTGRQKEDFLPQKMSGLSVNFSKLLENYGNVLEYFRGHREFFARMKTDDARKLVAYVVANTMRAETRNVKCSDILNQIAESSNRIAGDFIVQRKSTYGAPSLRDVVHQNNNRVKLVPALRTDVYISPQLRDLLQTHNVQRDLAGLRDIEEQETVALGAKLSTSIATEQPMMAAEQEESYSDTSDVTIQQSSDADRLNSVEEADPDHGSTSDDAPIVVAALLKTPKLQHTASPLEAESALRRASAPFEPIDDDISEAQPEIPVHEEDLVDMPETALTEGALQSDEVALTEDNDADVSELASAGSSDLSDDGSQPAGLEYWANSDGDEPSRQIEAESLAITEPVAGAASEIPDLPGTSAREEGLADSDTGQLNISHRRGKILASIALDSQPPLMKCTTHTRNRDYTGPEIAWHMEKDLQPPRADTMHVVLSAYEIDIQKLHHTHPLKNITLEGGVADRSDITFYQHRQTEDAEPQTFCRIGKKSFEISPWIEVPSSKKGDSASEQPSVGATKIVLSIPKFGTDSTVQEQKLRFYGEEFGVNDLQLLASSQMDNRMLLSLLFSGKLSSVGEKRASSSEKAFNLYLDLQKALLNNFSRDYDDIYHFGAISDAREMIIFFHSPLGIHFLQDVHRYRQQFEQIIRIMPAGDPRKQFLINAISAIDHPFNPGEMSVEEREVYAPYGFVITAEGQGTSEAMLRALYALTSPHYKLKGDFMDKYVDTCAEFLINRDLRLLLTITIMESMVSAIRNAQLQIMDGEEEAAPLTPLEMLHIINRCPIQQIHQAIPGLAESVVGVLKATLGIPITGLDADTMTQLCVISGFQDAIGKEKSGFDEGLTVCEKSASLDTAPLLPAVRNNVVAEAKLAAKNQGQTTKKEDFYQQISKKYKGVTKDTLSFPQLLEEMKNCLKKLDISECKELVANAIAHDINGLLKGKINAGEAEVVMHFESALVRKQECDIDGFSNSLSRCSARKIVELIAEQKEIVTSDNGFFSSITGDRVPMSLTHNNDIPVSVCFPAKRNVQEISKNKTAPSSYIRTVEASGISDVADQRQIVR
ncbi:MAG: hypothetical protein ACTJLL_02020 [Anaplasma sp.]